MYIYNDDLEIIISGLCLLNESLHKEIFSNEYSKKTSQ